MYEDVFNTSEYFKCKIQVIIWCLVLALPKLWRGAGGKENVRDYLIHIACIFSKPFIRNICK